MKATLEGLSKPLLICDTAGKLLYLNRAAESIFAVSAEKVQGRAVSDLLKLQKTTDAEPEEVPFSEIVENATGQVLEEKLLLELPYGAYLKVSYAATAVENEQGKILGVSILLCSHSPDMSESAAPNGGQSFFLKHEGQYIRVHTREIEWIEAMENYVLISTGTNRIIIHSTMKSVAQTLAPFGMMRVHRSYIVPLEKIESIEEYQIKIGEKQIPVGKSYRSTLMNRLNFI